MVDLNSTLIQPLGLAVNELMSLIKILVGGIFGVYVISLIYRIVTFRMLGKKIDKLFEELNLIKKKIDKIEKKRK